MGALDHRRAGTYLVSAQLATGVNVVGVPVQARHGQHAISIFRRRLAELGLSASGISATQQKGK